MIEEIVGLAENLQPIALIGTGGIGKTSIALKVLHHSRTKQRFGENRRFIRCDQFPATLPHFLNRLSKAAGAGVENPKDLTPLLPFLSSKEILIVLDNVESILDPQGTDAQDIYASVEKLCQLDTTCICITSRISTIPPGCGAFGIPTLSMEAARDVFYRLYRNHGRSDLVDGILKELEFHPLSVTLLATIAQQNRWSMERLVKEWEGRRTDTLRTVHQTSLEATIELSLASPMFKELGPDARSLLGVVAFYPQGVDENNIDWLFPTTPNRIRIFDMFCVLSLSYRSDGFITMLAPLRDHLRPKDPTSSPLLCTTKERYFTRMPATLHPTLPRFGESRWILSEDVNVEHLLDVFTSVDPDSEETWEACPRFLQHLRWHKPRRTMLKKKIEGLPDDHRYKPQCLFQVAGLYGSIGDYTERASLLNHGLKIEQDRGDEYEVAHSLQSLSWNNLFQRRYEEGIDNARKAMEIFERLGQTMNYAACLNTLAHLLQRDGQVDAAEEATLEIITLVPEEGGEALLYGSHVSLGQIYEAKGKREKAIYHLELALEIASTFDWSPSLYTVHGLLATLFLGEDAFDKAQIHAEQAKSCAQDNPSTLGNATLLQAMIWRKQRRFEDAVSEALRAQEIYEKLGDQQHLKACKSLLQAIEEEMESPPLR